MTVSSRLGFNGLPSLDKGLGFVFLVTGFRFLGLRLGCFSSKEFGLGFGDVWQDVAWDTMTCSRRYSSWDLLRLALEN